MPKAATIKLRQLDGAQIENILGAPPDEILACAKLGPDLDAVVSRLRVLLVDLLRNTEANSEISKPNLT